MARRAHFIPTSLRCLRVDRARLAAALAGVAAATLLVLLLAGARRALAERASAPIRAIGGDVWVLPRAPRTPPLGGPPLAAGSDAALLRDPCVVRVRAVVAASLSLRAADGRVGPIELLAVDPELERAMPWSIARALPIDLQRPDRVAIDALAASWVGARDPIGAPLEIAGRTVHVGAISPAAPRAIALTTAPTARGLAGLARGEASAWVADLAREGCAASLIVAVERDRLLRAVPTDELARRAEASALDAAPPAAAIALLLALGLGGGAAPVAGAIRVALAREEAAREGRALRAEERLRAVVVHAIALASAGAAGACAIALAIGSRIAGAHELALTPDVLALAPPSALALCLVAGAASARAARGPEVAA